jgi:hypothetical protein
MCTFRRGGGCLAASRHYETGVHEAGATALKRTVGAKARASALVIAMRAAFEPQ